MDDCRRKDGKKDRGGESESSKTRIGKKLAYETALVVVVGVQRDPGVLVALRGQPLRDGEDLSEPAGSPDVDL